MKVIAERRGRVWVAEVMVAAVTTIMLVPMVFLYFLDLAAGTIAPDAEWAIGYAIGLLGIWVAVIAPDSLYQRNPAMRWVVAATLVLATVLLGELAWRGVRTGGMNIGIAIGFGALGVALHQLVRLIRLPKTP